jgi:DNA-binding response OmpR family regulator
MENTQRAYVLVIGSDGPNRLWIETTLLQTGFVVACTEPSTMRAQKAIRSPRLIVLEETTASRASRTDLQSLARIRPLERVPWIIVSEDRSISSFGNALANGAAAYLTFPLTVRDFLDVVRRLSADAATIPAMERRRLPRRLLVIAIDVETRSGSQQQSGWMLDVSGSGCRIELPEAVLTNEGLRIMLRVGGQPSALALSADVKWQTPMEPKRLVLGLRFTGTSALLASKILGTIPDEPT